MSRVLNIEEDQINDQLSRDTAEEWDSFNHLLIISQVEHRMGIRIPTSEVEKIRTYADLKRVISHQIQTSE